MTMQLLLACGGVGLFLLGLLVLTEGLRGLAGNALRRVLARFTTNPYSGAAAGALTTAVIQSSSATTVTAVGFVGAGLLTFPQALGVVLGANIGTTVTGWLVAVLGFKLKLAGAALPLLLAGVLIRLFAAGRLRHLGWALAGFSLLFVGIDTIQEGMRAFVGKVTPEHFPGDSLFGRLQLVAMGIAMTVVTQSSSVGVATALVALGTGTISFPQAAAVVIGMDVGTTFKAILATMGGSTAMRQTGYAHVIYNLMTGVLAFLLLTPVAWIAEPFLADGPAGNAQIALVAFHTAFNALGVILVLPFTDAFAGMITRLVRRSGRQPLTGALDTGLLADPRAATDAVAGALAGIDRELVRLLGHAMAPVNAGRDWSEDLDRIRRALETVHEFIDRIHIDPPHQDVRDRRSAAVHALDHLFRLRHRCGQSDRIETLGSDARLRRLARILRQTSAGAAAIGDPAARDERLRRLYELLLRQYHVYRDRTAAEAAAPEGSPDTLDRLDSARWLYRAAYHQWRTAVHLRRMTLSAVAGVKAAQAILREDEETDRRD